MPLNWYYSTIWLNIVTFFPPKIPCLKNRHVNIKIPLNHWCFTFPCSAICFIIEVKKKRKIELHRQRICQFITSDALQSKLSNGDTIKMWRNAPETFNQTHFLFLSFKTKRLFVSRALARFHADQLSRIYNVKGGWEVKLRHRRLLQQFLAYSAWFQFWISKKRRDSSL